MTIAHLLRREYTATLTQLTIMERADRLYLHACPVPMFLPGGRYHGGPLKDEQVAYLTEGLRSSRGEGS